MRVCLITPRFPPDVGGVAQASYRRSQHLAAHQGDVVVLTPATWPQTATETQMLFQDQPWDLIHAYYPSLTGQIALQLSQWTQTPYVLSARGNDIDRDIWKPQQRPDLLAALQGAAVLTGVSRDLTRKLGALTEQVPTVYVPNSVDHERFLPVKPAEQLVLRRQFKLPADGVIMGFVGELRTKKGLSLLLKTFAQLSQTEPDFYLVLVGPIRSGEDQQLLDFWKVKYPEAARRLLRIEHVEHDQLHTLYPVLDWLVMPSFQEGMANAALEAMSSGVPVVSTDVGGFPDLLTSGQEGLLVEPYSEAGLLSALATALAEPQRRKLWGAAARHKVLQHFCAHHEQQAYAQVYAQALQKSK